jgi:hypothetical protein
MPRILLGLERDCWNLDGKFVVVEIEYTMGFGFIVQGFSLDFKEFNGKE